MTERHEIVSAVISDIKDGYFRIGDTISQRRIKERYGVGRWVAMRTLEDLEASNWLEAADRGRYHVAEITSATFEQALEMRTLLEIYAATKLVKVVTSPFIERLWKINVAMAEAGYEGKADKAVALNRSFHETFIASVDSGPLSRQLHQLYHVQGFDDHSNFGSFDDVRKSVYEHARIIVALKQRKRRCLIREIRRHIGTHREDWFPGF